MQIKNTFLFKNKWNCFIQKLSPQQEHIPERKYSDTISFDSNTSITDKFLTFLRRNSSGNISNHDIQQNIDYFQALYVLTLDEINYAEDSRGSSYYSGDLVAAREALDNCTGAFMQLLRHTLDSTTRKNLQSSISPKLLELQKRIKALPEENNY